MEHDRFQGKLDDETFSDVIMQYRERIFLLILRYVRNREDAHDLTQDTFVKAYRSRAQFRGHSNVFTWIYKIAVNVALNHMSRSKTSALSSIDDHPELEGNENPAATAMDKEFDSQLSQAIEVLPNRQRMVFILRYYEEKHHSQIAELMGITEGAVKANYHQAIRKIRHNLGEYLGSMTP